MQLSRFPFKYCITPDSITGRSAAELLLDRQPRLRLDLLHRKDRQVVDASHDKEWA